MDAFPEVGTTAEKRTPAPAEDEADAPIEKTHDIPKIFSETVEKGAGTMIGKGTEKGAETAGSPE